MGPTAATAALYYHPKKEIYSIHFNLDLKEVVIGHEERGEFTGGGVGNPFVDNKFWRLYGAIDIDPYFDGELRSS